MEKIWHRVHNLKPNIGRFDLEHLKKESTEPTYNPPVTQKPPVTYTQPNTYAPKPTEPWNGEFPKGSLHFHISSPPEPGHAASYK